MMRHEIEWSMLLSLRFKVFHGRHSRQWVEQILYSSLVKDKTLVLNVSHFISNSQVNKLLIKL